jgi:hypothetical protein
VRAIEIDRIVPIGCPQAIWAAVGNAEEVTMTSELTPAQPAVEAHDATWWDRHRDLVLYPAVFVVVVTLGLLWNPALSLVLTPVWMLLGVWLVPAGIARLVRAVRAHR